MFDKARMERGFDALSQGNTPQGTIYEAMNIAVTVAGVIGKTHEFGVLVTGELLQEKDGEFWFYDLRKITKEEAEQLISKKKQN